MSGMSDFRFDLKQVESKPQRQYRKGGSKYDTILDAFMEGPDTLAAVEVPDRDGNYLRARAWFTKSTSEWFLIVSEGSFPLRSSDAPLEGLVADWEQHDGEH